jgi:hypothetical protein
MSNERLDLKHYEKKYTFETPTDPNWEGEPWTKADLKVLLDELKRLYERENELLQAIDGWGMVICPRSGQWFEWDYGCQSESCVDEEDCRELVEQQNASK